MAKHQIANDVRARLHESIDNSQTTIKVEKALDPFQEVPEPEAGKTLLLTIVNDLDVFDKIEIVEVTARADGGDHWSLTVTRNADGRGAHEFNVLSPIFLGFTEQVLNSKADQDDFTSHTGDNTNPHGVTKAQVGLGNVPNSDPTDAINKAHDQGTDQKLDDGGANEVSASELRSLLDQAVYVDDVTGLRAISPGQNAYAFMFFRETEGDGGHGIFAWRSGDQSSSVAADAAMGIWVPPNSDSSGASGAWERLTQKGAASPAWWGFHPGASASDNVTAWEDATKALMNLYDGGTFYLESGVYEIDSEITVIQRIGIQGSHKSTIKLTTAGARLYVNNDGYGFGPLYNVRAGSLRDFFIDGSLTAEVGIRFGPTPARIIDNVEIDDCTLFPWELDKTQNCTFTNCRGTGYGADSGGNISPIQGAALHLANRQRNCTFINCHFGNKVGQHGRAHILGDWDSSLPNWDSDDQTNQPEDAASQNLFIGGIAERGDTEHAVRIESGTRNQFIKYGAITDTDGSNIATCIHLGADAVGNFFQSCNMRTGSGAAYVDSIGSQNKFEMAYMGNGKPSAGFLYHGVLIVDGIAGDSYLAGMPLFDNQTGGDPADFLRFTPNQPASTAPSWPAGAFVTGLFDSSGKRPGVFDGGSNDYLWGEGYSDDEIVTDGTVMLSGIAKVYKLNSSGAGINATLPDPRYAGQEVILFATGTSGPVSVTTESANIRQTSNSVTTINFNSFMHRVRLVALNTSNWAVTDDQGVTYS